MHNGSTTSITITVKVLAKIGLNQGTFQYSSDGQNPDNRNNGNRRHTANDAGISPLWDFSSEDSDYPNPIEITYAIAANTGNNAPTTDGADPTTPGTNTVVD